MLPVSGAGACIAGSTPDGGHSTPSDLASLSPRARRRRHGRRCECSVLVMPSGAIGAQLAASVGGGGAVGCAGVAARRRLRDRAARVPASRKPKEARFSSCSENGRARALVPRR